MLALSMRIVQRIKRKSKVNGWAAALRFGRSFLSEAAGEQVNRQDRGHGPDNGGNQENAIHMVVALPADGGTVKPVRDAANRPDTAVAS